MDIQYLRLFRTLNNEVKTFFLPGDEKVNFPSNSYYWLYVPSRCEEVMTLRNAQEPSQKLITMAGFRHQIFGPFYHKNRYSYDQDKRNRLAFQIKYPQVSRLWRCRSLWGNQWFPASIPGVSLQAAPEDWPSSLPWSEQSTPVGRSLGTEAPLKGRSREGPSP